MMQKNFLEIAKSIGSNAVVAVGTEPKSFTMQIAQRILGKGNSDASFLRFLPALIITNAHPGKLTKDSVRLVVPLRDAEDRFGGWSQFFVLLASYVRGESDEFVKRFEAKGSFIETANKVVSLKPGIFGLGINLNELVDRFNKRLTAKT